VFVIFGDVRYKKYLGYPFEKVIAMGCVAMAIATTNFAWQQEHSIATSCICHQSVAIADK
jgi:hypothetical protein